MTGAAFSLRVDEELLWDDHFCGAGGETTGLRQVAGCRVVHAANHDHVAIATHSHNYGDIEHSLADIPTMDPMRLPKAHVLWSSPECKARSYARGRPKDDPSLFDPKGDKTAEKSRATMDEVWRFAEARNYVAIVVENVPQAVDWCEPTETGHWPKRNAKGKLVDCNCGQTFRRWLRDGHNLGYDHRFLFLNSMLFPPTPQSRDRFYGVFVKRGIPFPNLDHTCPALCHQHGLVMAEQSAKGHLRMPEPVRKAWGPRDTVWGRYGQQYVYVCPECGERAEPAITPAATAIEWWRDPGLRIGERAEHGIKPLEAGTIERIARGILRLPNRPMVVPLHRITDPASRRARDVLEVLGTLTAQQRDALIVQVGGNLGRLNADGTISRSAPNKAWSIEETLRTLHGSLDRGLMVPGRENAVPRSLDEAPMPTCTTINSLYQLALPWVDAGQDGNQPKTADTDPLDAITTRGKQALVVSNMNNNVPRLADDEAMATVTTGGKLGVAQPDGALVGVNRRNTRASHADGEPAPTIVGGGEQHFLLVPAGGNNAKRGRRAGDGGRAADSEPMTTLTASETTSLVVANNGGPASSASQQGHARDVDREVLGTQTGGGQHAIVTLRGKGQAGRVTEPLKTIATIEQHVLAEVMPLVEASTFRMLEPSEIGRGMVMHLTAEGNPYVITGTRRQQVKQLGNAVTPPVAAWIAGRIRDALA